MEPETPEEKVEVETKYRFTDKAALFYSYKSKFEIQLIYAVWKPTEKVTLLSENLFVLQKTK